MLVISNELSFDKSAVYPNYRSYFYPPLQVDLKCIEAGNGGYYYPEHLPILGR